jgi:CheY-like chemotaxis protein
MGGIECTARIRKLEASGYLRGHLPIIAVSANTRAEQVQKVRREWPRLREFSADNLLFLQMLHSGMDGAIAKPFKISEVLNKIRTLID